MAQDLKEFKAELSAACGYETSPADLDLFFEHFGEALGNWMNKAEKHGDHWHGQQHGGVNIKMRLEPESMGTGPNGHPYTEEEHYVVYVKFSAKALEGMASVLGKPVKNG